MNSELLVCTACQYGHRQHGRESSHGPLLHCLIAKVFSERAAAMRCNDATQTELLQCAASVADDHPLPSTTNRGKTPSEGLLILPHPWLYSEYIQQHSPPT